VVAAVVGAMLGFGLVMVLSERSVPGPASVPVSLATSSPASEPAASDETPSPKSSKSPEPAVAEPVRVMIPAIDVDSELVPLGLNDDKSMEVPNFGLAGWYEPGPRPGAQGPAVIAAHVDSVNGPDVFFRLKELTAGDEITIKHADGTDTTFVVRRSEQQLKEDLPVDRIWSDTDEVALRLITCGGNFDPEARSYKSNVIVYARQA
jgi:sortase (surface protein transpeptidase)